MTQQVEEKQRISTRDIPRHDRSVADVVVNAVNNHGVRIKIIDGSHFMLYNGDPAVRPEKISSSRPAEDTMNRLLRWLSRNVPTWDTRDVKPDDLAALRDRFNGSAPAPEPEPEPESKTGWAPVVSGSGKNWGFETNGTVWRCTVKGCGHTQTEARGLHLHAGSHTGAAKRYSEEANKSRRERRDKEQMLISQAMTVLAAAHGFTLADKDVVKTVKDVERLGAEVERLQRQVEKITKERDEAVARLALIQEAMKA
jgi:hypothetical protein